MQGGIRVLSADDKGKQQTRSILSRGAQCLAHLNSAQEK